MGKQFLNLQEKQERIYLSGIIAGLDLDVQKERFALMEQILSASGYAVVNPFKDGLVDATYEEHMRLDIVGLLTCDKICMMIGWEDSKAARFELQVASECGLGIMVE